MEHVLHSTLHKTRRYFPQHIENLYLHYGSLYIIILIPAYSFCLPLILAKPCPSRPLITFIYYLQAPKIWSGKPKHIEVLDVCWLVCWSLLYLIPWRGFFESEKWWQESPPTATTVQTLARAYHGTLLMGLDGKLRGVGLRNLHISHSGHPLIDSLPAVTLNSPSSSEVCIASDIKLLTLHTPNFRPTSGPVDLVFRPSVPFKWGSCLCLMNSFFCLLCPLISALMLLFMKA